MQGSYKGYYYPQFFLFYNSKLLEIYNKPGQKILTIGFINNINILIYRKSIEENTRKLKYIYKNYIKQAHKYSAKFKSFKYKLIYFTRQPKQFNIKKDWV